MKILITGGSGFIGSNLALSLKEKDSSFEIVCLDNLKRRGSELNLKRLKNKGIIFSHGDIRNSEDLEAVGNIDLLIECSAEPSVHAGYNNDPSYMINTNLVGTINCLQVARKYKSKVLFLSTSRVYPIELLKNLPLETGGARFNIPVSSTGVGWSSDGINEAFPLDGVRSLYGTSKFSSELLLQEYSFAYDIDYVINRFGVVAGPWQMGKVDQGFMTLWIARHLYKKNLNYIGFGGRGLQVRDVLNIKDLCDIVYLQISQLDTINGITFNIGGGAKNSVSLAELTEKCREHTGNSVEIGSIPETNCFDIPYYVSDNSKIEKFYNWTPRHSLDETILDIRNWITNNYNDLNNILAE